MDRRTYNPMRSNRAKIRTWGLVGIIAVLAVPGCIGPEDDRGCTTSTVLGVVDSLTVPPFGRVGDTLEVRIVGYPGFSLCYRLDGTDVQWLSDARVELSPLAIETRCKYLLCALGVIQGRRSIAVVPRVTGWLRVDVVSMNGRLSDSSFVRSGIQLVGPRTVEDRGERYESQARRK